MLLRVAIRSGRCMTAVLLESAPRNHGKIQERFNHHLVRTVPVFPELQDYPSSLSVKRAPRTDDGINYVPRYREKVLQIQTCGKIYEKWRKERRYWSMPDGSLTFDVRYMDTGTIDSDTSDASPVVVALHGSPGSFDDFTYITRHLYKSGARVLAPCFPDISTFMRGKFRHTAEEKSEYARDFLRKLDIPKVDMLICHSSSLFPGLVMCLESQMPIIKSLCLLNPTAFDMPRVMDPFPVIKLFARLYEFPVIGPITGQIGRLIVGSKNQQLTGGHYMDHFLSAFTMVHSGVTEKVCLFRELVQMNFPIMMAFSENDKLIAKKSAYNMAKILVGDETEIHRFDKDGKLVKKGGYNQSKKALAFEKGTHFLFNKHPDTISEQVSDFLFSHFKTKKMTDA